MSKINRMLQESQGIGEFAKGYFEYLFELLNSLDLNQVSAFAQDMEDARQNANTVFFIGNGGSAATASHMVNDFGTDINKRTNTDKPFRVISLTDNNAVMLAVANDSGYENLFVNQLKVLYKPGDKLVAISVSGNSPNCVLAAEWVKDQGGRVISFIGFDGGKLKQLSDAYIHVKAIKGEYGLAEDIHLIVDHLVSYWLQHQIQQERVSENEIVGFTADENF